MNGLQSPWCENKNKTVVLEVQMFFHFYTVRSVMKSLAFKSRLQILPMTVYQFRVRILRRLGPPNDPLSSEFCAHLTFSLFAATCWSNCPERCVEYFIVRSQLFFGKNTNSSRLINEVWGFLFTLVKNSKSRFAAFISLINQKVGDEKSPGTQV